MDGTPHQAATSGQAFDWNGWLVPFVVTVALIAASTGLGLWMAPRWGSSAVDMLYLPAVLVAATQFGLATGFAAALGSALAYNFFFTVPVYTLRISRPADLVTVAILFLVALVTSQLAAQMRTEARTAAAHAARNATIAGFARRLLSCSGKEEIGNLACRELSKLFDCNAVLVTCRPDPAVLAAVPDAPPLNPSDMAAAAWTIELGEPAGRGTAGAPVDWQFYPVRSRLAVLAAMGLARDDGQLPVPENQLPLLMNLLDQVALILDRERIEGELRQLADRRERDRLRDALLSSVGHDLRTPLTAIIAATTELRGGGGEATLLETVATEAAKLDRYITNLLDMARIDAGAIRLKADAVDLVDAVSAALRDLQKSLHGHPTRVSIADDLPLVRTDPHLLHHCLINLLDNAARHSGAGAPIEIAAIGQAGDVILSIDDDGAGFAMNDNPLDTFARIEGSDQTGGAGLGLAIVKAFSEAMGIEARAARREPRGASFTLRFPRTMTLTGSEVGEGE